MIAAYRFYLSEIHDVEASVSVHCTGTLASPVHSRREGGKRYNPC